MTGGQNTPISKTMGQTYIPEELRTIATKVARGEQPVTPVRTLISWFWGSQRRGRWVVEMVRNALTALALTTVPDFEWTYIDGEVRFVPAEPPTDNPPTSEARVSVDVDSVHSADAVVSVRDALEISDAVELRLDADPMHRVARLRSAHTEPVSIAPDAYIRKAITLMMKHDYSQLPAMNGRTLKGFVSWKTIGRKLALGGQPTLVREMMDEVQPSQIVTLGLSLLEATRLLAMHEFLLVRDASVVCGIVTAYDFTETFGTLSEPFLLLGEIENHIRNLLRGKFCTRELDEVRDPLDTSSPIIDVSDLNFGGYVRLLQKPGNWEKLQLQLDRDTFLADLDEIRSIRNDVMHFDPDGISEDELRKVREFARLLRQVQKVRAD